MAIRFIDTSFYKSPFVRGLEGPCKGLYSFIICDCNASGIWSKDLPIASEYIGVKVTEEMFKNNFILTGKAIDLNNGKYFFPDFIEHQYPKGLQEKNPAHFNIIKELLKYNLLNEDLSIKIDTNKKGLPSPLEGSNVIVKVIDKVKVKVKVKDKVEYISNVFLTEIEIEKLKIDFSDNFEKALSILSNYKNSSGKKYKSDYHALMGWVRDKIEKENNFTIKKEKELVSKADEALKRYQDGLQILKNMRNE